MPGHRRALLWWSQWCYFGCVSERCGSGKLLVWSPEGLIWGIIQHPKLDHCGRPVERKGQGSRLKGMWSWHWWNLTNTGQPWPIWLAESHLMNSWSWDPPWLLNWSLHLPILIFFLVYGCCNEFPPSSSAFVMLCSEKWWLLARFFPNNQLPLVAVTQFDLLIPQISNIRLIPAGETQCLTSWYLKIHRKDEGGYL